MRLELRTNLLLEGENSPLHIVESRLHSPVFKEDENQFQFERMKSVSNKLNLNRDEH